jgi:WD40 repeat protein
VNDRRGDAPSQPSGAMDIVRFGRRVQEWADRFWWVALPGLAVPLVWGGRWWWLLVVLVPMILVGQTGTALRQEEERTARREAAAAALCPGDVLDVPAGKADDGNRAGGEPPVTAPTVSRRPAARVPAAGTPTGTFTVDRAFALAYAPRTGALAVGCADGQVQVWTGARTPDPAQVSALAHPGPLTALRFSPQGQLLITAGADGTVTVWDVGLLPRPVRLATAVHSYGDRPAAVQSVDVAGNDRVASGGADGWIVLWDLTQPHRPTPTARLFLVGKASDGSLSGKDVRGATTVSLDATGRLLAAGGRSDGNRPVQVWDVSGPGAPRRISRLRPHRTPPFGCGESVCHALAFSPRHPLVVTSSEYDYRIHPPSEYAVYRPHCHDSAVVLWDVSDPARPDGLVTLAERGGVPGSGWRGRPLRVTPSVLAGHAGTARCLAISPDGTRLATGDGVCLLLWDITAPARPVVLRILAVDVLRALVFSPDGRQLSGVHGHDLVTTWAVP